MCLECKSHHGIVQFIYFHLRRRTIPSPPPFLPPSNIWGSSPDITTLSPYARSTPRNIPVTGWSRPSAIMMRVLSDTGLGIRLGFSILRQMKAALVSTHSLVISLTSLWQTLATLFLFSSDCNVLVLRLSYINTESTHLEPRVYQFATGKGYRKKLYRLRESVREAFRLFFPELWQNLDRRSWDKISPLDGRRIDNLRNRHDRSRHDRSRHDGRRYHSDIPQVRYGRSCCKEPRFFTPRP